MKIKNALFAATFIFNVSTNAFATESTQLAPRFNNLGAFHHEISTKNPQAQQFFDQGLVLFYGFEWGESVRSFKEATRLDPECGMCYWGLALALGNIMNARLTGNEYKEGQIAIQKALSLKASESPEEQDYVKALSRLFQHAPKKSKKVSTFSCHGNSQDKSNQNELASYSYAMKKITEKYPDDLDAKALYAYALFNQIGWKFQNANGKLHPMTPVIIKTLESILAKDPLHVGGNHYYVHAIEASPEPEIAKESADRLKTLVPGSEHLVHMPSHIYFRSGRYHEATESNLQGVEAFKQYLRDCQAQGFKPVTNYLYFHNYDFLRSSAIMEGRQQLALTAANKMVTKPLPGWLVKEPTLQWFIPIPLFVKARFGMWKELQDEPKPDSQYQYALGMWHYGQGLALAHLNHLQDAQKELWKLKKIIAQGKTDSNLGESGLNLLKIANQILAGTIASYLGHEEEAFSHLKRAAKIQHDMGYHEPPDWYFPVKEILGDAYLKWDRPKEAIAFYQEDLKDYPQNGWALYGLAKALRAQGKTQEADQVDQQFKEAWKYADIPAPVQYF